MTPEINFKEWFRCENGRLFWIKKPSVRVKIGDEAGTVDKVGRRSIALRGKIYRAHRIIYWWFTGLWPDFVDHIKHEPGKELDNSFENLRPATKQENNKNRSSSKSSTSKYLGVSWKKETGKWVAHIRHNRKLKHLGSFDLEEDAALAYDKAAKEIHGEFCNLNFKEEK